jgi:hypothetical protein
MFYANIPMQSKPKQRLTWSIINIFRRWFGPKAKSNKFEGKLDSGIHENYFYCNGTWGKYLVIEIDGIYD